MITSTNPIVANAVAANACGRGRGHRLDDFTSQYDYYDVKELASKLEQIKKGLDDTTTSITQWEKDPQKNGGSYVGWDRKVEYKINACIRDALKLLKEASRLSDDMY